MNKTWISWAAGIAVLGALAGCGPKEEAKPADQAAGPAAEEPVLHVYNWSDYIAEDTLEKFTQATGVKVVYDVFDSNDVVEAKLLAGNTGGRTVRDCTLPAGSRALIPVHNTFCFPDGQFTEQQCLDAVVADCNSFTSVEATLDGVPQVLIDQPAVPGESAFAFTVPRNGIFGLWPGLYRATISAGLRSCST